MKRIGMITATVAVVMAMAATLAVASASAGTVLCSEASAQCESETAPTGTWLVTAQVHEAIGEGFKLSYGTGNGYVLKCGTSFINLKTTQRNAEPLNATTATGLNPKYCISLFSEAEGAKCSSASMNSPNATIEATPTGGIIRVGSTTEPLSVSYVCYQGFSEEGGCTYSAKGAIEMVYNRESGTVSVVKAPMKKTGQVGSAWCLEAKLSLTHQLQGDWFPSSARETVLCASWEEPCEEGGVLPAGSYLVAGGYETEALHLYGIGEGGTLNCGYAAMSFKTKAESGVPRLATEPYLHIPSWECHGLGTSVACTSTSIAVPSASLEATGADAGVIRLGSAAEPLTLSFTCEEKGYGVKTCSYKAAETIPLTADEEGLRAYNYTMKRTSGTCAETAWISFAGVIGGQSTLSVRG